VVTKDQEFLIRQSIRGLESELDPEIFWRIHRSTIINSNLIERISTSITGSNVIKLKERSELHTVSRSYAHIFKRI
jgi:DNA-binding LytR/AlgR family response regulator